MFDGDFDHCGIIVKDKYGCPYVYELTHNGAKIYPYSARVIRSKARQIIVVPILAPFDISVQRREELLEEYRKNCTKIGPLSYWMRLALGIFSFSVAQIVGPSVCRINHSPECSFVLNALKDITADSYDNISIPKGHTAAYKVWLDDVNLYSHKDHIMYVR